jgi:hypothetical protein
MGRLLLLIAVLVLPYPAIAQDRSDLDDALDKFAAALFDRIQPLSIADGVEYCGLLGIGADGRLAATRARRGDADSCRPDDEPHGLDVLASYHTHGAYDRDADTEVPSLDDLHSDIDEGIDGYIATPGGRLWLNDAEARQSFLLCGPGCIAADPDYRPCPAFPPGDSYTLGTLRARADNDTGRC